MPNRIRLTDLSLRALRFSDTQVTYWDETQPAFGVRIGRRSKMFIVVISIVEKIFAALMRVGGLPHPRFWTTPLNRAL